MTADTGEILKQIPSLRRYARALTRDADKADDLVQDCLERAWRRLHLWRPGSNLRAWLFTIMHNLYANEVRRYRAAPRFEPFDDTGQLACLTTSTESSLHVRDIETAIAALPDGQREVLLLVTLEALRYDEVAEILDIPLGTVMSGLHRARERLRGWMDGDTSHGMRVVK